MLQNAPIAKGRDGAWYLSIHLQGSERPMFEGDTAKWRNEWTIAHSVQRVEEPYHWDWPGEPIPDTTSIAGTQIRLGVERQRGKDFGSHLVCIGRQRSNPYEGCQGVSLDK